MACSYEFLTIHYCWQVMECLVQIASVRRSLFNEEERSKFILQMMQGIQDILVSSHGLAESSNYHEFCRMLARFRATYQLGEIAEKSNYGEWIDLVGTFSVKGFHAWQVYISLQLIRMQTKVLTENTFFRKHYTVVAE